MKKPKRKKSLKNSDLKKHSPRKSSSLYVTKGMLLETERSLKHQIASVHLEVRSVDKKIDSVKLEMDARFAQVDARFDKVDARFDKVDARFELVLSAIHKTNALVEEQMAQNRFVLDGYTSLYDAQEVIRSRLDALEGKP